MPKFENAQRNAKIAEKLDRIINQNAVLSAGLREVQKRKPDKTLADMMDETANYLQRKGQRELAGFVRAMKDLASDANDAKNPDRAKDALSGVSQSLDLINNGQPSYKQLFEDYIRENKYTALENKHIKNLSTLFQMADDIGHQIGMEEKMDTLEYINKNKDSIDQKIRQSNKDIGEFVKVCAQNNINPRKLDTAIADQQKVIAEAKTTYETLKAIEATLTETSNSEELKEVEIERNHLLGLNQKVTNASKKIKSLDDYRDVFLKDIKNVENTTRYFNNLKNNLNLKEEEIEDLQAEIEKCQKIYDEGQETVKRFDELDAKMNEINGKKDIADDLETAERNLAGIFNDSSMNISDLVANEKNLDDMQLSNLEGYRKAKETILANAPELAGTFDRIEKNYSDFRKDNEASQKFFDTISEKLEALDNEIADYEATPEYIESADLQQKAIEIEEAGKNVPGLKAKLETLQQEKQSMSDELKTVKKETAWVERIKSNLGFIPDPLTQKNVMDEIRKQIIANEAIVNNKEIKQEIKEAQERMVDAQKRADELDKTKISEKVNAAAVKAVNEVNKLEVIKNIVKQGNDLKNARAEANRSYQAIKNANSNVKKLDAEKEIIDKLESLQAKFKSIDNKKYSGKCQTMLDSLQTAIDTLKDPESNFEARTQALDKLHADSAVYVDDKNGRFRPSWFANEQRHLRISVGEEIRDFSQTANDIVKETNALGIAGYDTIKNWAARDHSKLDPEAEFQKSVDDGLFRANITKFPKEGPKPTEVDKTNQIQTGAM